MKNVAIFASGSGSNAQRIIEYFDNKNIVDVKMILCNKKDAFVLERARTLNVPSLVFNRDDFYNSSKIIDLLKAQQIDLVILAGFLWLIPENLVKTFPGRIINIHPALLPKYGGKGMYGHFVHEAIIANHEKESGITIHFVNEHYDKGDIIFQAKCPIELSDTPDSLAEKIHHLEYKHFPEVIEKIIDQL